MGEKGNVTRVTDVAPSGYGDGGPSPVSHLTQAPTDRMTGFGAPHDAPMPPPPGHRAPGLGPVGGLLDRDHPDRPTS